jgi:hypothetical protein
VVRLMRKFVQGLVNRAGYHVRSLDDLTQLMNEAGSDKGFGLRGRHYYTRVYSRLLGPLRDSAINFVEIGLLRPDRDNRRERGAAEGTTQARAHSAPSLQAWRQYFSKAHIVGFDIDDFSGVNLPGTKILQGDMSNLSDLKRLIDACPGGTIDVVIDDGSHASHHQQIAFSVLFPRLNPGGIYFIEDCHWQDPGLEQPGVLKTKDVFQGFRRTGVLESTLIDQELARQLAREIESVKFSDSIEGSVEDTEDALCVIRKRA